MALWLYGFMALWLYGFMALCGRFKNIFIVLKHRLMQLFQIEENHQTTNYSVFQNFAVKSYLHISASGNSLRRCYRAIAGGVVVPHSFVAFLQ
jgi:hypothetical protein